jgi:hypothetical protein
LPNTFGMVFPFSVTAIFCVSAGCELDLEIEASPRGIPPGRSDRSSVHGPLRRQADTRATQRQQAFGAFGPP